MTKPQRDSVILKMYRNSVILTSSTPLPGPTSGMNVGIVIPTKRPVSLDVVDGITFLAEQDCQNEEGSDRGIWRGDTGWCFRNGGALLHFEILQAQFLGSSSLNSSSDF